MENNYFDSFDQLTSTATGIAVEGGTPEGPGTTRGGRGGGWGGWGGRGGGWGGWGAAAARIA